MKRVVDIVATEGYERHNARGMDFIVRLGGKTVRLDPSPRYFQKNLDARDAEGRMQEKLMDGVDAVVVSHFHNDHFGPNYLRYLPMENDVLAVYHDSFEQSLAGLPDYRRPEYRKRLETVNECCGNKLVVKHYARLRLNGLEMQFRPFKHSSYKGQDLGEVMTVFLSDGDKRLLFSSDVSGPEYAEAAEWIIGMDPHFLILDGPFNKIISAFETNEKTLRKHARSLEHSYGNLADVISDTESLEKVLLCHHFVNDFVIPKNDLENIPAKMKGRLDSLKAENFSKRFIDERYGRIERSILKVLDAVDDSGVKVYLPSMVRDGRITI